MSEDIPFVFDLRSSSIADYSSDQLVKISATSSDLAGVPSLSTPRDNEILSFPIVGGGNASRGVREIKVSDLKSAFDARVEPKVIHSKALLLAGKYPGERTIQQICAIYNYLKHGDESHKGWSYVEDPRFEEDFSYANRSLSLGEEIKCAGIGDCDDFAILMAGLIESIGIATRINMAHDNDTRGHAYTEVYLGKKQGNDTAAIINWLMQEFDIDKVYTHINLETQDVWLNLDWSAEHPGGPFYRGERHVILLGDNHVNYPVSVAVDLNNQPPKIINLTSDRSSPQDAGAAIAWDAKAREPEGDPILYRFFLDDVPVTEWRTDTWWVWTTSKDDAGDYIVGVQVRDGKHAGPDGYDSESSTRFTIKSDSTAIVSGVLEASDTIANTGNFNANLLANTLYDRDGVAIWSVKPDANFTYLDELRFYAMLDKNNNKISVLLDSNSQGKSLRGMIPSLHQAQDTTLSSRPDPIHYCYQYDVSKTLIYNLLEDTFDELKAKSVINSEALLEGEPKYKSSFADNISIFGYYITSTAYNNDNFCYHNWPWGTGSDECKYGPGSYICDYSTGSVEIIFDFSLTNPKNYYLYGFINNDNGEEARYIYNNDSWLHQINYGPGSVAGEKYGGSNFPSQIKLYSYKNWSANRLMIWMAIDAESVSAKGHINGSGSKNIDRYENPDVLEIIPLEKKPIRWPAQFD